MAIKKYKPTSPARRQMTVSTFEEITKKSPERSLLEPLKSKAGRNSYGRITVRHRGGGVKRKYRVIDFKRTIRTEAQTSLCFSTKTARRDTSSLRTSLKQVMLLSAAKARTSVPVTLSRYLPFR